MKKEIIFTTEEEMTRTELERYLNEKGVMQKKLASLLNLPCPYICMFLKRGKHMDSDKLILIREYISC